MILGYDAADRMASESRTIAGAGTAVTTSLAYDNADRTTAITHQIGGGASLASLTYVYDSGGRLTAETNHEGAVSYTYDAVNQNSEGVVLIPRRDIGNLGSLSAAATTKEHCQRSSSPPGTDLRDGLPTRSDLIDGVL